MKFNSLLRHLLSNFYPFKFFYQKLNNQFVRDVFVAQELKKIKKNSLILDAGCGSQRYKGNCSHLRYKSQDFGEYATDLKKSIDTSYQDLDAYAYGSQIDYIGNIWDIKAKDNTFDAVLCTEVLEHIPYPIDTIKELSRILKKNGILILTAPSNCLRHMDPYFFYTGFTDRFYEKILGENNFSIKKMEPVGDYYSWMSVEVARTAISNSILAKLILFPTFLYYAMKRKTPVSVNSLCMGYHIVAIKN
ncbi:putative Methyltransferase type 11 [Candidatus Methylopumilus planktonicus]|uniref:Putative Methyltransferase type 11 n=1 Tax=Candidatus Methylopumilus planktonicus TaxID=1581557 RepID=A0A0D6EWG3_9PROT|nr:class I SAM-dependent methyltransferase [Candidatus Methylopumilus planktonicus]CEZ19794.1 putative Methyltransferase type 11 [Candidatus Methylopumilus planktonicus]